MLPPTNPASPRPEVQIPDLDADLRFLHGRGLLNPLLADRTTGGRIVWATDAYSALGLGFQPRDSITPERLLDTPGFVLRPRAAKALADRSSRTKTHAEVFTPLSVCRRMLDALHLPKDATDLLDVSCLEIACGEAPFLSTRYDPATGIPVPPAERFGILDRKLRAATALAASPADFPALALRAYRSTYGFEFQGDNLLIARINLFMALFEACPHPLPDDTLREIALTIAANLVQMNGLSGTIPYPLETSDGQTVLFSLDDLPPPPTAPRGQTTLFDIDEVSPAQVVPDPRPAAVWTDWRNHRSAHFPNPEGQTQNKEPPMKFNYVIGNPPYQEETDSESTRMPPIYNYFMDAAYDVAEKVCLITPARFLFNAGYTPRVWNEKMLADAHLAVLEYIQNSKTVFADNDIKGGVAITYRDAGKTFGAIGTFTVFPELNSILLKVHPLAEHALQEIITPALSFKLSPLMLKEHPESLDRLRTSCFETLAEIFFEIKPRDRRKYIQMLGILDNRRTYRWVRRDYLTDSFQRLDKYKVILPASNGSGALGEVLSTPLVGKPGLGVTQSFITIGSFESRDKAEACLKYIKTKFVRVLLGILKITQHNPPEKWKYVPLQDFTPASDIDWSQSVADIDRQLYAKYGLTKDEITFVETHVREME